MENEDQNSFYSYYDDSLSTIDTFKQIQNTFIDYNEFQILLSNQNINQQQINNKEIFEVDKIHDKESQNKFEKQCQDDIKTKIKETLKNEEKKILIYNNYRFIFTSEQKVSFLQYCKNKILQVSQTNLTENEQKAFDIFIKELEEEIKGIIDKKDSADFQKQKSIEMDQILFIIFDRQKKRTNKLDLTKIQKLYDLLDEFEKEKKIQYESKRNKKIKKIDQKQQSYQTLKFRLKNIKKNCQKTTVYQKFIEAMNIAISLNEVNINSNCIIINEVKTLNSKTYNSQALNASKQLFKFQCLINIVTEYLNNKNQDSVIKQISENFIQSLKEDFHLEQNQIEDFFKNKFRINHFLTFNGDIVLKSFMFFRNAYQQFQKLLRNFFPCYFEKKNTNEKMQNMEKDIQILYKKIDTIEERLDTIEQNQDAMQKKIDTIEQNQDAMQKKIDTIEQNQDAMQKKIDLILNILQKFNLK